jgi:hypothetical protein
LLRAAASAVNFLFNFTPQGAALKSSTVVKPSKPKPPVSPLSVSL